MNYPDCCIIVASNGHQAEQFERLIQKRIERSLYPCEIAFRVYADPEEGRVGSGGGTLHALDKLYREYGHRYRRILMIHAGGESRRLPCYVPEGKVFAPLSCGSSSIVPPTILDAQLSLFLKYPWKDGEFIVASGDVVLDFDTDLVPEKRGDVCGFATAASFDQGSRHGVFKFHRNKSHVTNYLQKASSEYLEKNAALEGSGECALDIGLISFSPKGLKALISLGGEKTDAGESVIRLIGKGRIYFDLYLEVMTACLKNISRDDYLRATAESSLEERLLTAIYQRFKPIDLHAVLTKKTGFYHFGSLSEYLDSSLRIYADGISPFYAEEQAELKPEKRKELIVLNSRESFVHNSGDAPVYMENCIDSTIESAGGGNLFIGLEGRHFDSHIPVGICVDERRTAAGSFILVYGCGDTWKKPDSAGDLVFCGMALGAWLKERNLTVQDVFAGKAPVDLYDAKLFYRDVDTQMLKGYWDSDSAGTNWTRKFKNSLRQTTREINTLVSAVEREEQRYEIRRTILETQIVSAKGWNKIHLEDFKALFRGHHKLPVLADIYKKTDDDLLKLYRRRLLDSAGWRLTLEEPGLFFDTKDSDDFEPEKLLRGVKTDQLVWARSPVRFDLAGGWSDTPPYTLREGGSVVNIAVNLNGQPPIQAFCKPTNAYHIKIHSIDLGVSETIDGFENLENYRDPQSPFALPKASLCLLGITSEHFPGKTLRDVWRRIGCGLEITLLCAVPKGSGLGTSSILGATIIAALERFFGRKTRQEVLFRQVLQLEQMLTTGGGWQDQIGGVVGGVKYVESKEGMNPDPLIYQLDANLFTIPETAGCFTLFYTGITRLAKNLLQEVVDNFNGCNPSYLFTVRRIALLARYAREAVSLRSLGRISNLLNESWKANKLIHPSTTNEVVESILSGVDGLYSGMKLLGAGGGGYMLFVSESTEQASMLREKLSADFENDKARIVEFSINHTGLQISVS